MPVLSRRTFDRLTAASRSARQRLDSDSSGQALHDAALFALRLRDSTPTGLDDADRFLTRARERTSGKEADAAILNDFAVVQLELGQREQSLRPFLVALDAIERSVAADSTLVPALFNRALILEHLYLLSAAQRAWSRYLAGEPDAGWRQEARVHEGRLAHAIDVSAWAQGGRDQAFQLLGEWGRAFGAGDSARAATLLEQVHSVAASLDSMPDQSVRFAVAAVDSQLRLANRPGASRQELKRLAAAHVELSNGLTAIGRSVFAEAADRLERAERELHASGSAAAGWAALYRGSAELNRGRYDTADHILLRLLADTSAHQPALVGKAVSTRGVIQVRRGNFELGNQLYRAALPDLVRAREPYNEGGTYYLLSESLSSGGQYAAGRAEAYRGLRLLAPYRKTNFLSNHLATVVAYARADSLPFAALAVMDEVLSVARGVGKFDVLALAYRTRARDLVAVGRRDSARVELATAMRTTDSLEGHSRERTRTEIQLVQGQLLRADDPAAARALLESVVGAYRRLKADSKVSAASYETALAARDAGDTVAARDWLVQAIEQIERQQRKTESSEGRAALFETADNAFDALIDLELRAHHADAAFTYLERERSAAKLATVEVRGSTRAVGVASLASIGQQLPEGMLFVEYALLHDRAIVWTASRRGTHQYVVAAPRDTVATLVNRFVRESSIPAPRDGDARSRLFELLLRPLAADLEGMRQISIVPDRELSRLPFAALWDRGTQRYVIDRYEVRTEPSAAFQLAVQAAAPAHEARRTALVVGNPTLDTASIRLESLPAAESEARRVAAVYTLPTLLTNSAARRDTVVALMRRPKVFHFAGHAVFDGDRPELSYLALGPSPGGNGSGALAAWEIGKMRLSNLEIVVLSACRTVSSRTSRTGGVAGLASSFLRAGAPAVISTLWDVSDGATEPLLASFHQHFATGLPAAAALRQAQLEALGPPAGRRAAPSTWAAFIYTGP